MSRRSSARSLLTNLGLSAYLASTAAFAVSAAAGRWQALDALACLVVTCGLVLAALRRPPPRDADARPGVWLLCACSSLYFLAFEEGQAPFWVISLHLAGDASLLYLGRSFALLPARRQLRTGFAYRLVRHPTYATYLLTDAAFVAASPSAWNACVALVGAASLVWRAELEERLLAADPDHAEYRRRTPHRFIPFVY
jgi:protein-S-isoprenylcysteine O-methyltransferase Ste14